MPTVRISDDTANALKKLARPLEDTWDTYLGRAGRFLSKYQDEFLAFEAAGSGDEDQDDARALGGDGAPAETTNPLQESVTTAKADPDDSPRTLRVHSPHCGPSPTESYSRADKIAWVIEHMRSWISRSDLLQRAERAFPDTPTKTLVGTIAQAWTDCTNPKYDAPFRRRGFRAEEQRLGGVHEKRVVPL